MSVTNLTKKNFKEIVMDNDKPVLIDFWATWCGPCRMQGPVIEELAQELQGSAVITKLNVDESPEIAEEFCVMSIPTLILIKDGKVVSRKTGYTPKSALHGLMSSVRV